MVKRRVLAHLRWHRLIGRRAIPQSRVMRADIADVVDRAKPARKDVGTREPVWRAQGDLIGNGHPTDEFGHHAKIPNFDAYPKRERPGPILLPEMNRELLFGPLFKVVEPLQPAVKGHFSGFRMW